VDDKQNVGVLRLPPAHGMWLALDVVPSTGSTNADLLARAAADPASPEGQVLIAEEQTAGRGRLGRSWSSVPGASLTFSVLLRPVAVPRARLGWLPLLVGVSVAAAVRAAAGVQAELKWPNDVIAPATAGQPGKLGGILAEVRHGHALVGIGINLSWAPEGAARLDEDRDRLLDRLMPLMLRWSQAEPHRVLARWRDLSWTLGHDVRVELGGAVVEGRADDIDFDGALLVGGRRVVAGDVTRVRRA